MDGRPLGAAGEYAIVNMINAEKVPDGISPVEAAALVRVSPALKLSETYIRKGDRVLIFGASGGMGSLVCQLARNIQEASLVVGVTSKLKDDVLRAVCHEVIDYTTTDVFTNELYDNEKFDLIIDLFGNGYQRLEEMNRKKLPLIIKTEELGGRFVTTVPPVGATLEVRSVWQALKLLLFPILWKVAMSRTFYRSDLPAYSFALALTFQREIISKTFALACTKAEGTTTTKIKAMVDPKGPFPFTTKGVREAFKLQESRHPRGKVVISVRP
jgi:threonine dehydrogenase-like Zn-dependent dehydrogenase